MNIFKHLWSMLQILGSLVVRVSCWFLYNIKNIYSDTFAKHIYSLIMLLPFSVLIPIFVLWCMILTPTPQVKHFMCGSKSRPKKDVVVVGHNIP